MNVLRVLKTRLDAIIPGREKYKCRYEEISMYCRVTGAECVREHWLITLANAKAFMKNGGGNKMRRATGVTQLVKRPTLAQAMIPWFVGSSPALGSVLTAWSLEPASDSKSPSLPLPHSCSASLSLSKISKYEK